MNRVRGTVVAAGVAVLLFGSAAPALAKGGYLELDRRYYAPGNVAIAKRKSYPHVERIAGTVYAYLGSRDDYPDPQLLPEGAAFLGSTKISDHGASNRTPLVRFEFAVPEVAPGWYWVRVFDAQGKAVGSFQALLRVVRTTELALRKEVAFWEGRLNRLLRHRGVQIQRMRERIGDLELLARENVLSSGSLGVEPQAARPQAGSRASHAASSNLGWGVAAVALAALAAFALWSKRLSGT